MTAEWGGPSLGGTGGVAYVTCKGCGINGGVEDLAGQALRAVLGAGGAGSRGRVW